MKNHLFLVRLAVNSLGGHEPLLSASSEQLNAMKNCGAMPYQRQVDEQRRQALANIAKACGEEDTYYVRGELVSDAEFAAVGTVVAEPSISSAKRRIRSVRPLGLNSTNGRGWDPVVVRDFKAALYPRANQTLAQPSSETSAWIIKQTQVNVPGLTYAIEDENLIRRLQLASPMSRELTQQTIPIAKITPIGVMHTDKYLSYKLSCDIACVEQLSMEDQSDPDEKKDTFLFEIYQNFHSSFPPRMNRALQALIQEHGGKAKLYELPKPKEAF